MMNDSMDVSEILTRAREGGREIERGREREGVAQEID